jgi:hypothetical protein
MRINDILVESKVNEAPMGALSKIGNKVAAAFGSGKSQGKVDTGTTANELKQSYMRQLGQTGQEAEAKSLVAFLKAQGYPTAKAKAALGIVRAPAQSNPQATQAAQTAAPADAGRPQGGGKVAGQQSQTPGAIAKRNSRRDATNATATTGGAGAFNQMTKQVTQPNDPAAQATAAVKGTTAPTTQLKTTPATTAPDATQQDPQTTPTTSKALGPKGRATLGRLGKQKQSRSSGNQGTLDLNSRQYTGGSILEALGDKQLDAAFLAAAQERAALGGKAPAADAEVDDQSTDRRPSGANALARAALGLRQRGSAGGASTGTASPLDGIDVETLRSGLESVINDRPINRSARVEIQKLIKQL